jgi:hypothetical protein
MFTAVASVASTSGDVSRLDPARRSQTADVRRAASPKPRRRAPTRSSTSSVDERRRRCFADGQGDFTLTDADGDDHHRRPHLGHLVGPARSATSSSTARDFTNVGINDNSPDATFDGSNGGSFSTAFNPEPDLGALITLSFDPSGGFFSQAFSSSPTLVDGTILPTPGAGLIIAGAGLAFARRRRG